MAMPQRGVQDGLDQTQRRRGSQRAYSSSSSSSSSFIEEDYEDEDEDENEPTSGCTAGALFMNHLRGGRSGSPVITPPVFNW